MKASDLTPQQLEAAKQYLWLMAITPERELDSTQIISMPWESLLRLVALYGAVRGNAVLSGASPALPGEIYKTGLRTVETEEQHV